MIRAVRPAVSVRRFSWMARSVSVSTELVASSRIEDQEGRVLDDGAGDRQALAAHAVPDQGRREVQKS